MTINTLNLSTITQAVETLLEDSTLVGGDGVSIDRSGQEPSDPPPNGWVGIYRVGMQFPERVSGAGYAGRAHRIDLMFWLVQTGEAGDDCEDRLSLLVKNVLDALLNDGSFGGTVDVLDSIEVRYPDYQRSDNEREYRQTAFIFITGLKAI